MFRNIGAIDIGTTKIKAGIYDETGNLLNLIEIKSPLIRKGFIAEHNSGDVIKIVKDIVTYLSKKKIKCIGLTTYRGSLIIWDKKSGLPLTNIITWMDLRSSLMFNKLPLRIKILSKLPKIGSIFSPESLITRLAVLLKEREDLKDIIYKSNVCIGNVDSYIIYNLSRKCCTDPTIGSLTGIYHPKDLKSLWGFITLSGIKRFEIPTIINHEEIFANLNGISIGGVIGDQQAASLGSDCLEKGCLKVTLGSGLFLDLSLKNDFKLITKKGLLPIILYRSSRHVNWGVEAYIPGVGTFVDEFLSFLGRDYNYMENSADINDPLFILPTLYGLRYPKVAKGFTIIPLDYKNVSAKRLIGSVLHSIALLTLFYYRILAEEVFKPIKIIATGGLSRSRTLVKLIASYIKEPVLRTKDPHMSLRGAARLAMRSCFSQDTFSPPTFDIIEPEDNLEHLSIDNLLETSKILRSRYMR